MLNFGLAPAYVLDEMQVYEINALMDFSFYRSKESWEQARLISYLIAQTNSKKKLKLEDIMKFSWDNKDKPDETFISSEDISRLSAQAAEFEKIFSNQN